MSKLHEPGELLRRAGFWGGLIVMTCAAAEPAVAGTLRGKVLDHSGQPPAASVIALGGGNLHRTTTDLAGKFALELPAGEYTVFILWSPSDPWGLQGVEVRPEGATELEVRLEPLVGHTFSFPEAMTADLEQYRKALDAFGEPPFCSGAYDGESYRFLWLRAFDAPVFVRVIRTPDGDLRYEYKRLEGVEGDEGPVAEHASGSVLERLAEEWPEDDPEQLRESIEADLAFAEEGFWQQPYARITPLEITVDGAGWTVEGRREGRCHVVSRRSPDRGDPFRRFAEALLFGFAGKRFFYDEVY